MDCSNEIDDNLKYRPYAILRHLGRRCSTLNFFVDIMFKQTFDALSRQRLLTSVHEVTATGCTHLTDFQVEISMETFSIVQWTFIDCQIIFRWRFPWIPLFYCAMDIY